MMDLFTTHYISLIGIIAAVAYIVQRKVVRFYLNRSHYTYRSNFNKLSVKPELIVYGVKTNSLVHIIDVLCKKGFIIFPTFKVLNAASSKVSEQKNINDLELEGTYVLTLGLSLKLVKTLTHIYSKVQVHDDHIDSGGSDALRVLLFDKIAAIIRRIPVEYKSIQPIHDDTKLTDLINTIGSSFFVPDPLFPIRDYFGPRLAVLFSWHYYLIGVFAVCSAISLLFIFVPKPEYYPILSILSSLFMSSSFAYYRSRFEKKAAELTPLKYTQEEEEIEYTALAGKEVSQLRLLWVAVSWSIASLVPILQIVLATYIKIAVVIGLTYYEATSLHSVTEFTHFQFTILGSVLYSGICHLMTSTLHTYLVPLLLYIEAPVTSSEKRSAMGSKETIFRVFVFIAWLGPDMFQYLSTFSTSDIITQTSLRSRLEIEFLVLGLVDFSLIHGLHSYIFGRFLDYMYKPHDHTLDVEHLHKQSSVRHLHLNRERSSTFSSKIISPKAPLSWPVYNTIKNTFQKLRQTDEPKDGITETSVKETEPKDTEIFEFQLPRGLRSLSHASSVYFDRDTLDDGEEKFDDTAPAYKNDIVKSNNNTASGTLPTTNTTTAATTANQNALVDTTATENSAASQMLSRVDMALETDEDGNPIPQPLMTEDAVTEIDNEVPDDTGNNNNDYSLTAPSSDDALLFRECSGPKFDYKTKQFHIYAWVILSGLVSPLSPLVYPTFFIFFWVEFKTNFYELLTCRRTSAEEASIDPWLHQMEILSIFSLVYNIFVFSYMGSFKTWDLSILHFPLRFAGASEYIISALDEPVVRSFVTTVLLEHMSLIFRVLLLPYALKFMSGHTIRSIQALKRVMMLRENLMAKLLIQKDANTASTLAKSYSNLTGHWGAKMRLAEIQSTIGTSMSPMIWVSLSLVPFLAYYYFNVPWWLTFIPLFIALCYQQNKIDRQKRGIAMNIVSDSTVFDFIKKELPGFLFDSDLNRSDWCNDMFTHTWPMLVKFGQNKILSKVKPVLEKSCPSFFHKLEISKLDLGTQPPSILGIRILEGRAGADMVEMDMDWKWVSNMKASLSLYLTKDTKVTISVSNFQFSGKARYQLTPLIPKVPPFGTVKGTFFQKPFVDFTLSFGDVDLMNLG